MNLHRAASAFEDFTGERASKVSRVPLDDQNVAAYKLGKVVGIAYEARRDGKSQRYFHEFKANVAPDIVVREDGKKLYIAGGRYKVTDRGIEDMPYAFVVNPAPRSKGKKIMARRRTRSGQFVRARKRRASRQVAVFNSNPTRRRRRRTTRVRHYARNPIRRTVHRRRRTMRFRRNPSMGAMGGSMMKLLLPAIGIGAGAVGSEIIMGRLPIPANLKTGMMRHITKAGVSLAVGMAISKFGRMKRLGTFFALGGVAIAAHDMFKDWIVRMQPGMQFGMYTNAAPGGFLSSLNGMPADGYMGGVGMYMPAASRRRQSVGYYNPANTLPVASLGGVDDYSGT